MRILFQYFTGGGGALSNIILLLNAISREYPQDNIDIVCSKTSDLHSLASLPNVDVLSYGGNIHKELDRFGLGFSGLTKIAHQRKSDVIWSLNLGAYFRGNIPQVLSVNNPHQVYPWDVTRYHPDRKINVATLRWFFRRTLRASDAVIVQTPIMGDYVSKIYGAPKKIKIVPKAVENVCDFQPQPLPNDLQNLLISRTGDHPFTFLYVSTYYPHKNHKTIVDTFEVLAKDGINARIVLTIKPEELLSFGGEKAKKLLVSGHLVPVGWAKKEYLNALYDACDACLMPSVLESLSSAHLEAMQWGKPQITADMPYARDLCGDAALYAAAEDSFDWVAKIKQFMDDDSLRATLIDAGHARMKEFPKTWADSARSVHVFLEDVIKNHACK